jgi:hypothetical protein
VGHESEGDEHGLSSSGTSRIDREGRGVAMKKEGNDTVLGAREFAPALAVVVFGSLGGSILWL